ncbi:MAG: hypothetical protein MI976_27545 [Pseudomonadales bacterium]|nr:hypothetical protein [Pseudomonadales bacterium]
MNKLFFQAGYRLSPGDLSRSLKSMLQSTMRRLLPLYLALQKRRVKDAYRKILIEYQLSFLQRTNAYPDGVPYHLISKERVDDSIERIRFQSPIGVQHQAGDTLLLRWQNTEDESKQLIDHMSWDGDQQVHFWTQGSAMNPSRRILCSLREALQQYFEIRTPSVALLQHLDESPDTASLRNLSKPCAPEVFLQHQKQIKARSYSVTDIKAGPNGQGEIIEILFSDVADTLQDSGGQTISLLGRSTAYIHSLTPSESVVRGWPLRFPLRIHPYDRTNNNTPILLISTGIAVAGPILEWSLHCTNRPLWIVLGLRQLDQTQRWLPPVLDRIRDHPNVQLDLALSRADSVQHSDDLLEKVGVYGQQRVQDLLTAQSAKLQDHLANDGQIIIIGHTSMGLSVQHWLKQFLLTQALVQSMDAADNKLRQMEQTLQIQYSLSGR